METPRKQTKSIICFIAMQTYKELKKKLDILISNTENCVEKCLGVLFLNSEFEQENDLRQRRRT